jgi:oxygen-independent coproporphyrinogen-3 oxidase
VDPRTISVERIETLRRLGFNRLSFGVQDFDPDVQAAVNRPQSEAQIRNWWRRPARRGSSRSVPT